MSVEMGVVVSIEEALKIARSISDERYRSIAFRWIAFELAEAGEFEEALEIARSVSDERYRSNALANIASELAKAGGSYKHIFEEALETARSIDDEHDHSWALANIASELAKAGGSYKHIFEEALETARSIDDDNRRRSWALKRIVSELAEAGEFEAALEIARSVSDEKNRSNALANIASELAKAGKSYKHIFEEASEAGRSIDDDWWRSWILRDIASELAKAGEFEEALEVTRSISDDDRRRSWALANIASELAKAGEFEESLQVARSISDETNRSNALANIASELADAGKSYTHVFEEALETARSVTEEYDHSEALANIASELADAGEPHKHIFEEALEVARSISDDDWRRSSALGWIASKLTGVGNFEEALRTAKSIDDEEIRSDNLADIAPEFAKASLKKKATERANKIIKEGNIALISAKIESGIEKYQRAIEILEHYEEWAKVKELRERIKDAKRKKYTDLISAVESEIMRIKSEGVEIPESEELLLKSKQVLDNGDYEKALEYAKQSEEIARRIREESKPEIALNFPEETLQPDVWKRINITITNTGSMHANEIEIKPSGDIEFKRIPRIPHLNTNETKPITIAVKPIAIGDVPVDIAIKFKNTLDRSYTSSEEVWITVAESAPEQAPLPGASPSKQPIINIIESVVQRPSFGGIGDGTGAASADVEGSVVQRPQIGSIRRCPNCGEEVQADEKYCTNCGAGLE